MKFLPAHPPSLSSSPSSTRSGSAKGGVVARGEVEKQVEQQKAKNKELASRNAGLMPRCAI